MRFRIYAASIFAASLLQSAVAATVFTETAYDVKLQYVGEPGSQSVCIAFDANGRLSIGGHRRPMVWAARPGFPDQFLAVTGPSDSAFSGNTVGMFGRLSPDNELRANGIDRFGIRFNLYGDLQRTCAPTRTASRRADPQSSPAELIDPTGEFGGQVAPCAFASCTPATDPLRITESSESYQALIDATGVANGILDPCASVHCTPHTDPLRAVNSPETDQALIDPTGLVNGSLDPCASVYCTPHTDPLRTASSHEFPQELVDPTGEFGGLVAPCQVSFCDPALDPTGVAQNRPIAFLAGRSFALTLGNGRKVKEYCWTFGSKGRIRTAHDTIMTWTPKNEGLRGAGFESVGISYDGQGMAYHGQMVGNLLQVIGIEAGDSKSKVFEGYGQPVDHCKVQ